MVTGAMLICFALFVVLQNTFIAGQAQKSAQKALNQLKSSISLESTLPLDESSPSQKSDSYNTYNTKEPVIMLDDTPFFGIISIPATKIELPLIDNFNYTYLNIAPCRYRGSIDGGDLVIIAHNYASHFGQLSSLVISDRVRITLLDGFVFDYTVVATEKLDGYDVEKLDEGNWDLTLFTCDASGSYREVIRCKKL